MDDSRFCEPLSLETTTRVGFEPTPAGDDDDRFNERNGHLRKRVVQVGFAWPATVKVVVCAGGLSDSFAA
jgi:hypothetical protein